MLEIYATVVYAGDKISSSSTMDSRSIPGWLKKRVSLSPVYTETLERVRSLDIHTVCEEAACPNITECWSKKHATVMILGRICTRACRFCNVATGKPTPVDPEEPYRTALLVKELGLKHVVITSVDRDDLDDGGAMHFSRTIQNIRLHSPNTTIEVLTPDFLGKKGALEIVLDAGPDVFNHNVETVARLYSHVRPKARYFHSLYMLKKAKDYRPAVFTKSGFMVGLGEERLEIRQLMNDLRQAEVDFLTIGQYLQPTPAHYPVHTYVTPEEFLAWEKAAYQKGFLYVSASPLTRSSYHAGEDFKILQDRRKALQAEQYQAFLS